MVRENPRFFFKRYATPFRPSAENCPLKRAAGLPAYNALVCIQRIPAPFLPTFYAVKADGRSYGCGGSGAIRKIPISLFPIKPYLSIKYRSFVFGCIDSIA